MDAKITVKDIKKATDILVNEGIVFSATNDTITVNKIDLKECKTLLEAFSPQEVSDIVHTRPGYKGRTIMNWLEDILFKGDNEDGDLRYNARAIQQRLKGAGFTDRDIYNIRQAFVDATYEAYSAMGLKYVKGLKGCKIGDIFDGVASGHNFGGMSHTFDLREKFKLNKVIEMKFMKKLQSMVLEPGQVEYQSKIGEGKINEDTDILGMLGDAAEMADASGTDPAKAAAKAAADKDKDTKKKGIENNLKLGLQNIAKDQNPNGKSTKVAAAVKTALDATEKLNAEKLNNSKNYSLSKLALSETKQKDVYLVKCIKENKQFSIGFTSNSKREKWIMENWNTIKNVNEQNINIPQYISRYTNKLLNETHNGVKFNETKQIEDRINYMIEMTKADLSDPFRPFFENVTKDTKANSFDFVLGLVNKYGNPKSWKTIQESTGIHLMKEGSRIVSFTDTNTATNIQKYAMKIVNNLG
jgi:hypothetical protein